jgi:uncharacterized phiE125 gp8 family phage protein
MIVIEEPPAPPVTLAEVKAFLRIGTGEEDDLLAGLVRSAGEMCEGFTGRSLLARDVIETLPAATAWTRLGAAPVRGIGGVEALDAQGEGQPLPADAYAIDTDAAGDGWVRLLRTGGATKVRVAYSAGMAAAADGLPEALRHGVVRLAAHLYTHRDRHEGAGPPAAVTALWRPWRRLRIGPCSSHW